MSFGLVNVPVRLYSATENHDLSFRQVRASDGSRIRYKRVAQADGEEVAYKDIAKAYETDDGKTVVLTDEDLASLPNRSSKEISVDRFVPADQIDPILYDKAYFLEPDAMGAKAYGLLREALRETDRVAVVTVSVRTRMTMAVLRVMGEAIVLQTLLWPDEVRDAGQLDHLGDVSEPKKAEIDMARMLVESMAGDFEPEGHVDDYKEAVEALVASKIEGGEVTESPDAEDEAESGEVVDLLAALQRSVDRAKKGRGTTAGSDPGQQSEDGGDAHQAEDTDDEADDDADEDGKGGSKAPAKKSTARKSTSRSAAKKTTAKKTTAAKSPSKSTSGRAKKAG